MTIEELPEIDLEIQEALKNYVLFTESRLKSVEKGLSECVDIVSEIIKSINLILKK